VVKVTRQRLVPASLKRDAGYDYEALSLAGGAAWSLAGWDATVLDF
jgi:hypothetical protein